MLAVLGKLAYAKGFAAAEILQYRFGVGALLLLAYFAVFDRQVLRASPRTILKALFLGVVLYPVQSLSFMTSLKYIPAATTSLILYFYPVSVSLLSALLFKTAGPGGALFASASGGGLRAGVLRRIPAQHQPHRSCAGHGVHAHLLRLPHCP